MISLIQQFERRLARNLRHATPDEVCAELASLRDSFGAPATADDRARLVPDAVALFAARAHALGAEHARGMIRFFVRQQREIASLDSLAPGLTHPEPEVRVELARFLASSAPGRALLLAHLLHDDEEVRVVCAEALALYPDPALVPELRELRELEAGPLARAALDALLGAHAAPPPRPAARAKVALPELAPLPPARAGSERARIEALAAAAAGARGERIYLVHEADEASGLVRRPGSLSGVGGAFALVLDLAEIPELAARFPDARALGLRVPEPELGQRNEEATLVRLDEREAREVASSSRPLALTPIAAPEAVFTSERPREHADLWEAVLRARGHVLGRSRWIHRRIGDDGPLPAEPEPGFVLQLNDHDGRAPVNLGQGSLYVSEGSVTFQCL